MSEHTSESGDIGYLRDRSFYGSRPSGSYSPAVHRESVTRRGMAACDTSFILLNTDLPIPLRDDAAQKMRWCLRCWPVGRDVRYSPGEASSG